MTNYEVAENYRKDQLQHIEGVLKKLSEIIAFIRVYGSMYDSCYNGIILNLNNIGERFLDNLDSRLINELYDTFARVKNEGKSPKDVFLGLNLYKLPVYAITETSDRRRRHETHSYNLSYDLGKRY